MKAHYDKVIIIRDGRGSVTGFVLSEPERDHRKTFYAASEMGMDDILRVMTPEAINQDNT